MSNPEKLYQIVPNVPVCRLTIHKVITPKSLAKKTVKNNQRCQPGGWNYIRGNGSVWGLGGHEVSNPERMPQKVSLLANSPVWGLRGHKVTNPERMPQNVSLLGKWSSLRVEEMRSLQPRKNASKCFTFGQMVQSAGWGDAKCPTQKKKHQNVSLLGKPQMVQSGGWGDAKCPTQKKEPQNVSLLGK